MLFFFDIYDVRRSDGHLTYRRLSKVLVARLSSGCVALSTPSGAASCQRFGAAIGCGLEFGFSRRFLVKQRLPVGNRDLIVVWVYFVEGEEAVAIAAVVDKCGLQGRLNARHLGEIDIAAQQLTCGALEVEFFYPAVPLHHDPESPRDAWHR